MKGRIQIIEALRGIAAMQVLCVHLFPGAIDRAWGVDLFFAISGYVMVISAQSDRNPRRFISNRLIRIVPLYWLVTAITFVVALLAPQLMGATKPEWSELLKSLTFIPFEKSNGLVQPVLFLGWTLNYEIFFYSLFSAGLLLPKSWSVPAVIASIGILVGIGIIFHPTGTLFHFYTAPELLEFAAGSAAGLLWRAPRQPNKIAVLKPLAAIGTISYALYLTHPFVIGIGRKALGSGVPASIAITLGAISAAFIISQYVDSPLRQFLNKTIRTINKESNSTIPAHQTT